jgi:hypothetical protein
MIVYDTHVLSITDRESVIYNNKYLKLEFEIIGGLEFSVYTESIKSYVCSL